MKRRAAKVRETHSNGADWFADVWVTDIVDTDILSHKYEYRHRGL